MCPAMNVKEASQRVRRGQEKALRLQRRLWLAQLALWPTLIAAVVLTSIAAWALWRRKPGRRQFGTAPVVTHSQGPQQDGRAGADAGQA